MRGVPNSVETNKQIRTKHEHRQPRKFRHAHITIIYIVSSATKEILIKWGKKCVLVMLLPQWRKG